ncbi:MAG: ribonuclease P protein component [Bacilli bacterium]|nr:ribonuclease P protein component [Bacilli bacterium]
MKKKFRIKKNKDFKRIISKQNILRCDNVLIFYMINKDAKHVRIGISISSKIKGSVIRNKIKRQIKAMANEIIDFNKENNIDIIFFVKKQIINFHSTLKMLKKNLEKLNV